MSAWLGGNQESETARPIPFMRRLQAAGCTVTLSRLAEIERLPFKQRREAEDALGAAELQALDRVESECNTEIAYLLRHLAPNTVASVITQYRRVLDEKGMGDHPYTLYFRLPDALATERKTAYRASVMSANKALKPLRDIPGYLKTARRLITRPSGYMQLAIGLVAATGRRPGEILVSAKFDYVADDRVIFHGQLKTKDSELSRDDYEIPVLLPASEIITGLAKLREMRDFSTVMPKPGKTLGQAVNAKTAKQQGEVAHDFFSPFTGGKIRTYDLRAIYYTICKRQFKPGNMTDQAYGATILGHSENDSTTAASYEDFYIED